MRSAQDDVFEDFELHLEHFIRKGRSGESKDPSSANTPMIQEANDEDFSNSYYTQSSKQGQLKIEN